MVPVRRKHGPTNTSSSFGSPLLGSHDESSRRQRIRVQVLFTASIVAANMLGTFGVSALLALLVPRQGRVDWEAAAAGLVYLGAASLTAFVWGTRLASASLRWTLEDRDPDPLEQRRTLRVPMQLVRVQAVFWTVGAVFFALLNNEQTRGGGVQVGLAVFLAGIVTCACAYLLTEFAMRPISARALAAHPPESLHVPGVQARTLLAWATGSAIPVVGMIIGAAFAFGDDSITRQRLALMVFVLGGITLVAGLLLIILAVRATVDPIRSLRFALTRVESGDLDVQVPVYDGTEVGLLQAGFNRMVDGLRERERIRYLFERHVGEDVARDALTRESELSGEVRHVAVLFVDLVGSTQIASVRPPREVVDLLNRFFTVVVDVVDDHGGIVNKLVGDAVLAVWGAPTDVDDPAGRALSAARHVARRLEHTLPDVRAGVGVAAGEVVAGNIGDQRRFEYTVIGDPVNEAARLTEMAKGVPGGVLASSAAVAQASTSEAARWQVEGEVNLRGRSTPTTVARPRDVN